MISEGQRNDITYAVPLLEQIDIKESRVLADKGYDSNHLIDYIYDPGGEPTIPSRKGAKFERHYDWFLSFLIYILSFFNNMHKNNCSIFFDIIRQIITAHKKSPFQTPTMHLKMDSLFSGNTTPRSIKQGINHFHKLFQRECNTLSGPVPPTILYHSSVTYHFISHHDLAR